MSSKHSTYRHALPARDWQIGTYEWWPSAQQLTWSPELIEIYGCRRTPASEDEFNALVHPDDRVRVEGETSTFLGSDATRYSHSFRILRPDGTIRVVLDRGSIVRDGRGNALTIYGANIDITEETHLYRETEERLRASEGRYRKLFEVIDDGFCVLEVRLDAPDGRTDYRVLEANPAFYAKTGFTHEVLGRWLREAAPQLEEHWHELYGHVARTGESKRLEQDSRMLGRWFDVYAFRIDAAEPSLVGVLFNDISDRKRHEEHTQLLLNEVSHRSKNMMALVQAIARQTARSSTTDFLEHFYERVQALAAQQDLLVQNAWQTVPLADLARSQLAHFSDLVGNRIALEGPPLSLKPDAAQALGMALHELATNAAKYGALSNEAGRIDVRWWIDAEASPAPLVTLEWLERGGPPVTAPAGRGFGSKVTKEMVEASTGGDVVVDYHAGGLAWTLACPAALILT